MKLFPNKWLRFSNEKADIWLNRFVFWKECTPLHTPQSSIRNTFLYTYWTWQDFKTAHKKHVWRKPLLKCNWSLIAKKLKCLLLLQWYCSSLAGFCLILCISHYLSCHVKQARLANLLLSSSSPTSWKIPCSFLTFIMWLSMSFVVYLYNKPPMQSYTIFMIIITTANFLTGRVWVYT